MRGTALIGFLRRALDGGELHGGGQGTPDQAPARLFAYRDPDNFAGLIDILVRGVGRISGRQLQAGADAVQIFDTWAGVLPPEEFARWCIEPTRRIVAKVRGADAGRQGDRISARCRRLAGALCRGYRRRCGRARLERGSRFRPRAGAEPGRPVQGNLDPLVLVAGGAALDRAVDAVMEAFGGAAVHFQSRPRHRAARRRSRMSSGCSRGVRGK